jgi:hypothetical protein
VNGYNSGATGAINFMEWCQDHNKPIQVNPFGDVAAGGPATLPDPNVFTNGPWYSGSPYFGPDANLRATMPACVGNPYGIAPGNPANAGCTTLVALPQRARDYHEQRFPRRNAHDDAGGFAGICD